MPSVLLRPQILGFKNKLKTAVRTPGASGNSITLLILALCGMYISNRLLFSFLSFLMKQQEQQIFSPAQFLQLTTHSFFGLLIFSNFIAAVGYLFRAQDTQLLFTFPISDTRKFLARVFEIIISSSWMALFFGIPLILAYGEALNLPLSFYGKIVLALPAFLLIPALIGAISVIVLLSVISFRRFRDVLILTALSLTVFLVYRTHDYQVPHPSETQALKSEFFQLLSISEHASPWLPSSWFAEIFLSGEPGTFALFGPLAMLYTLTALLIIIGIIVYRECYARAWSESQHNTVRKHSTVIRAPHSYPSMLRLPASSQLRALLWKDTKMFFRDPAQSLQLFLLLILTFLYLYNFKTLRSGDTLTETATTWWRAILALVNIALGGCVISAIATRLVFPCVSLEGKCMELLLSAPISIERILISKFYTWLFPTLVIAVILLLSGAWALFVPIEAVFATAFIAACLSISTVGLAVGIGSVYAQFDWETPTQLAGSFGSLMFMLFTVICMSITLIPAGMLLAFTAVPSLSEQLSANSLLAVILSSGALCLLINVLVARHSLRAGAKSLRESFA